MIDKDQLKARIRKLETNNNAERPEIRVDWDDIPEGANPEPGELWIIWEPDGSFTTKRGNPDGSVTVIKNDGAEIQ